MMQPNALLLRHSKYHLEKVVHFEIVLLCVFFWRIRSNNFITIDIPQTQFLWDSLNEPDLLVNEAGPLLEEISQYPHQENTRSYTWTSVIRRYYLETDPDPIPMVIIKSRAIHPQAQQD